MASIHAPGNDNNDGGGQFRGVGTGVGHRVDSATAVWGGGLSGLRSLRRLSVGGVVSVVMVGTAVVGGSAGVANADPLPPECAAVGAVVQCTYAYTGAEQAFTVPVGVTGVEVSATGGHGGGGLSAGGPGGVGAKVSGHLATVPGQQLYLLVGGNGAANSGGFNGGGIDVSPYPSGSGGGGGASDVRTLPSADAGSLLSRVLVAGGGGGGSVSYFGGAGGAAGAPGSDGSEGLLSINAAGGGGSGTATMGGAGGVGAAEENGIIGEPGIDGGLGVGGAARASFSTGGSGGGGLYGGGGGGGTGAGENSGAGGGGGSSLIPSGGDIELAAESAAPGITITYVPATGTTPQCFGSVCLGS